MAMPNFTTEAARLKQADTEVVALTLATMYQRGKRDAYRDISALFGNIFGEPDWRTADTPEAAAERAKFEKEQGQ